MDELKNSISQYYEQLAMVSSALESAADGEERESLLKLSSELQELISLTEESLKTLTGESATQPQQLPKNDVLDEEYALFKQEIEKSELDTKNGENISGCTTEGTQKNVEKNFDIQEELSTLLGMKCAVYHIHKWGGKPSLHNAMVSAIESHDSNQQFEDLQVQVLFTHPTHAEMLPCPFYLEGECKFSDEQCRYSHGVTTLLSDLKDAIEPNFESIKVGSRILLKIKPPSDADISLKKKSAEKYHLWHRAVVKSVDFNKKSCSVKLEQGIHTGEKRKLGSVENCVSFEDIFPLNNENDDDPESDEDNLSDTEYLESKVTRPDNESTAAAAALVTDQVAGPPMGEWERHTRGIGSKLMLAMGYVPGRGLGAAGEGRVQPVQARLLPAGKSLDHCMEISERAAHQDPLKMEMKMKKLQKRVEERNKRAYEREKERERRNVFNFLNKTLGDKTEDSPEPSNSASSTNIKQTSSKDLNIEKFKIAEDTRKIERDLAKLNNSLSRYGPGTDVYIKLQSQISEKSKELNILKNKEHQISKEQNHRKNKQSMTLF